MPWFIGSLRVLRRSLGAAPTGLGDGRGSGGSGGSIGRRPVAGSLHRGPGQCLARPTPCGCTLEYAVGTVTTSRRHSGSTPEQSGWSQSARTSRADGCRGRPTRRRWVLRPGQTAVTRGQRDRTPGGGPGRLVHAVRAIPRWPAGHGNPRAVISSHARSYAPSNAVDAWTFDGASVTKPGSTKRSPGPRKLVPHSSRSERTYSTPHAQRPMVSSRGVVARRGGVVLSQAQR